MRLLLTFILCAWTANAATYYIDYASGSDANDGTAKLTPWKKAPGMKGFAGSYSHTAGDRFIFKGGVTWLSDCYQWKVTWSGTSASVQDYYGVDETWYAGASFTRPLFDFERVVINGWQLGAGLLFENVNYVTIDNLEFANHATPLAKNGIGTWLCTTIAVYPGSYITLTNSVVRDWWQPNTAGVIESGTSGGGGFHGHYASNLRATHCTFYQTGSETKNGNSVWNVTTVDNCEFYDTPTAIMTGFTIYDNHIHDLTNPSDPAAHANVALCYGTVTAYRNLVYNIPTVAQIFIIGMGKYTTNDVFTAYNNIIYNVEQPAFALDNDQAYSGYAKAYLYNNTAVGAWNGANAPIRYGTRSGQPLIAYAEVKNNHWITQYSSDHTGDAQQIVSSNNLTNTATQATAYGYTSANYMRPTSGSSPTVGIGANLSSTFTTDYLSTTRSVPWDAGAYEWDGEPAPAGSLAFNASSYSTAEDTTVTLRISRSGGTTGAITVDYDTVAGTATATTDYTAASATANLAEGVAYVDINITILRNATYTGNTYFTVTLSNPTGGATLGNPTTTTVNITDSDEPDSEIPTLDLDFDVTEMLMVAPFTVTNGIVSQTVQTLSTNDAGRLVCYFTVPTPGTYQANVTVNAAATDRDSFNWQINGTNDIYDIIPLTVGSEVRTVNWRGSGTYDVPEHQPAQWTLDAGDHLLAVYGREANVGISHIQFVLQSAPPPPPQQLSMAAGSVWVYDNQVDVQLVVNRVGTSGEATVAYATANDTALAGTDYTATSGTLTFADGESTATITIPITNISTYQLPKVFTCTLSSPSANATVATPAATSVVILSDNNPTIRIMNANTVTIDILISTNR